MILVLTDAFTRGKECEVTYAQPSFRPRVIMKDISIEMLAILSVSDCCIQVMDVYNINSLRNRQYLHHIGDTVYHQSWSAKFSN